jgi:hypothetical protein
VPPMAQRDHKLFTTPVSVNDGLKRSDGKTWATLGIVAVVALVIVALINLFVEKPAVRWPTSPAVPTAQTVPEKRDEPRTYDVAPPPRKPQ